MTAFKFSSITRRGFMAAGAAAGLSALAAPASALPSVPRAGLIGCGAGGARIAASLACPGAPMRLAGVCDHAPEAAALASAAGVPAATDWERFVQRPDIDIVIIATPDGLHAPMAMGALEAGKHVYLLPPVAATAEEARALCADALGRDRLLFVGMGSAASARWQAMGAQMAARGEAPRWIQANLPRLPFEAADAWTRGRSQSLGLAARQVFNVLYPIHHHLALGAPRQFTALGGVFDVAPRDTADTLAVTARYSGGTTAAITCMPVRGDASTVVRGSWGTMALAANPGQADSSGYDLDAFARALSHGHPASRRRLVDACTVQAALCDAVDALIA